MEETEEKLSITGVIAPCAVCARGLLVVNGHVGGQNVTFSTVDGLVRITAHDDDCPERGKPWRSRAEVMGLTWKGDG